LADELPVLIEPVEHAVLARLIGGEAEHGQGEEEPAIRSARHDELAKTELNSR
jgi:hypothetical protein